MNKQLMLEYHMATGLDPIDYDIDNSDDHPTQGYTEWMEEKAQQRKFESSEARKLILEIMKASDLDADTLIRAIEAETEDIAVIIWGVDDFKSRAKEISENTGEEFDESEMSGALKEMVYNNDCNYGVSWDTVDDYLERLCKLEE